MERKVTYLASEIRIQEYYESFFKLKHNIPVTIQIHDTNFLLKTSVRLDEYVLQFAENMQFYYDEILVLTYTVDKKCNVYQKVASSDLFINMSTYDKKIELEYLLTAYENTVELFNVNNNPKFTYFDDAFIVHFDDAVDRMKSVLQLCELYKTVYLVRAAPYRNDARFADFVNVCVYSNYCDQYQYLTNRWHSFTFGSIGLAISNLILLKFCLKNGIEKFMIHEDDVVFLKDFCHVVQDIASHVPPDSDILYWGIMQGKNEKLTEKNQFWYHRNVSSWGTHAYSIQNKVALERLISTYSQFYTCIDCYKFEDLKCYVSKASVFIQDEHTYHISNIKMSRIHNDKDAEKPNHWGYQMSKYEATKWYDCVIYNKKDYSATVVTGLWQQFTDSIDQLFNNDLNSDNCLVGKTLVFFDFVDREFGWDQYKMEKLHPRGVPWRWAGIVHHPLHLKKWEKHLSVSYYMTTPYSKKCLKLCQFLIVLSSSLRDEITSSGILAEFNIPIHVMYHIAPAPSSTFTFDINAVKYLTFIGWSFRNFTSFIGIYNKSFKRKILHGTQESSQFNRFMRIYKEDNIHGKDVSDIEICEYMTYAEYIQTIRQSILFVDFDGVSANNAIVEAIAHHIPIILPDMTATRFYLGDEYPLYFTDPNEIDSMLEDKTRICQAHMFLVSMSKLKFTKSYNIALLSKLMDSYVI